MCLSHIDNSDLDFLTPRPSIFSTQLTHPPFTYLTKSEFMLHIIKAHYAKYRLAMLCHVWIIRVHLCKMLDCEESSHGLTSEPQESGCLLFISPFGLLGGILTFFCQIYSCKRLGIQWALRVLNVYILFICTTKKTSIIFAMKDDELMAASVFSSNYGFNIQQRIWFQRNGVNFKYFTQV